MLAGDFDSVAASGSSSIFDLNHSLAFIDSNHVERATSAATRGKIFFIEGEQFNRESIVLYKLFIIATV